MVDEEGVGRTAQFRQAQRYRDDDGVADDAHRRDRVQDGGVRVLRDEVSTVTSSLVQ